LNLQHLAEGSSGTQLPCEISAFDLPPFPAQAQSAGLQDRVEQEPNASLRMPLRTFGPGQAAIHKWQLSGSQILSTLRALLSGHRGSPA